ncbi:glycosyltransferase [Algoriphagus litoralis]|uniref:glycosyltransferase n=1 Tax=Algoriphagus litoralis TaxID=2202829 RepID=UPI000DB9C7A1|nr:glycosyltransferase [Algoriphagus litoralis]
MISFYLLWIGCYVVLLGLLAQKWPRKRPNGKVEDFFPAVTIVIPFRNELKNLPNLLSELQAITYPDLDVLLVDDQSDDDSVAYIQERLPSDSRIRLARSQGIGKKEAIEYGVKAAKNDLILCSDADCSFPEDWVNGLIYPFSDPKIQLVAGPVMGKGSTNFFERFQQIEWSSILLVTQYFFSKKQPLMCSGANLAYRKSTFEAVGGYFTNKHHLSGDDEFLLKRVADTFGGECCVYLPFSENLVHTQSVSTVFDLINQRVRWAGKWKAHREIIHLISAVFSFVVQLVWLVSLLLLFMGTWEIVVFWVVWIGKIAAERLVLGKVLNSFGKVLPTLDFLKTGFVHPFYVLFVGFGVIRGKFTWKGRSN